MMQQTPGMRGRSFQQVDVFGEAPLRGNPVAVVLDGEGLSDEAMQRLANWTNLSETTFVLPPTTDGADYRVRIFTPTSELPFAGHPTLGTCHAWLATTGAPVDDVVQECAAGLVHVQRRDGLLAFAAPPLVREGPVGEAKVLDVAEQLGVARSDIVAAQWVDNGPGWLAVQLPSVEAVLAVRPGPVDNPVGVVGLAPPGAPEAIEVRAFVPKDGATVEDPVTGSLNASLAQWLLAGGVLTAPYVARQGTALGRAGRAHISTDGDTTWVGGATVTLLTGTVDL
jgi:PhzF family phenazine biosynthesis protein